MKKLLKRSLAVLCLSLAALLVWLMNPLDDLQSWRWFTLMFETPRAELFTHWQVIQHQATLSASSSPREYARNTQSPDEVFYEFEGERYPLTHYLDKANITGFMVLAGGEVRLEYYGKGFTSESRNHIWSATKSYTSTLVGMALHDGTIASLDDLVQQYAPQFKGTAYGEASIRHVMMMSSGIDYFHFKGSPNRNDMYWDTIQRGADFDDWAGVLPRRVAAGTDFNYIATDTHVLSAVLRGAYGKPYVEIVQEKLWEPGGFGAAQWGLDASGHAMGHCCLSIRLQDFAHLGQLYLEDLVLDGEPRVGEDWIGMVEKAQAPFQEPSLDEQGDPSNGYSFQFWLPMGYDQEFIAAGAFGQYIWTDRKHKFVVAQFSTGQSFVFPEEGGGASPGEFAAVMRAMRQLTIP